MLQQAQPVMYKNEEQKQLKQEALAADEKIFE
jgi:hypothetical protein